MVDLIIAVGWCGGREERGEEEGEYEQESHRARERELVYIHATGKFSESGVGVLKAGQISKVRVGSERTRTVLTLGCTKEQEAEGGDEQRDSIRLSPCGVNERNTSKESKSENVSLQKIQCLNWPPQFT